MKDVVKLKKKRFRENDLQAMGAIRVNMRHVYMDKRGESVTFYTRDEKTKLYRISNVYISALQVEDRE